MRFQPHPLAIQVIQSCMLVVLCVELPPPEPRQPTSNDLASYDPRKNITCLGDESVIGWNIGPARYQGTSMQKLCADPQYGGDSSGPNLRGYCHEGDVFFGNNIVRSPFQETRFAGNVQFNPMTAVDLARSLRNYLECRNRCFCNYGLEDPSPQPRHVAETRKTFDNPTQSIDWTIRLDTQDKAEKAVSYALTRLYFFDNYFLRPGLDSYAYRHEDVGIDVSNRITCDGPLPTFALPAPYDIHNFANNQALCATQLSGGSPAANAGAYCHQKLHLNGEQPIVSFADDQTPRLDWTWNPGSGAAFFKAASLRFHCWKNCACSFPGRVKNYVDPTLWMWEWMVENMPKNSISTTKGSRYPMGSSTDENGVILTTYKGSGSGNQRCAANADKQGCDIPWPVEILGPVPKAVMRAAATQPQAPTIQAWETKKLCGNKCSGMEDCGEDCLCRMPSTEEARALGVDPIVPAALCLGLASVFGRELGSLEEQVDCLCNATYIAPACCHSRDGIV